MMRIVDVNYVYDETLTNAEEQLRQHYTSVGIAEALARKGAEITVVKRFSREASFKAKGVEYHFIKDQFRGSLGAWQIPKTLFRKVVSLDPDIVQLHEFFRSVQTLALRRKLNKKTAIVIQHHGGSVRHGVKKPIHDLFNSTADAFFFSTKEQGEQWFRNKRQHHKIFPLMEGSTFFNYETRDENINLAYHDRNETRKLTGMNGEPVFLWVGRLDDNKDPLTVLEGFKILFPKYPGTNLYMIYSEDKLIDEIKSKINDSDILKPSVYLLGKIPHEEIQNFYNSADFFLLGSHYEGSGYALSEAMRCGCVPVITNIPSFRMMTKEGNLGALWNPGNKDSFVEAVNRAMNKPLKQEAEACIDFYKKYLSFDAIAEQAIKHYTRIMELRTKKMK